MRRKICIYFCLNLIFFGVGLLGSNIKAQLPSTKPNILVIITDDQRYNTIHALGNEEINTPNMDNLVKEGTSFTQAHIMGGLSGAVCQPSRAQLLSGRTLYHLRKDGEYIPPSDTTFPQLFRNNGYITFGTGKWHQDKVTYNRSFDTGDNILFGGMNPPDWGGQYRPKLYHYDPTGSYNQNFWGDHFSSIYFADASIQFLEKNKDNKKPFLMYVSFTSPHDPRTAPSWYGHSYKADDVSLPISYEPYPVIDNGELDIRDEMLLPYPRTKEAIKTELAKYYSMISEVDFQIGRIIDKLKEIGQYNNTIIVFAGDNGLNVGDHGLLGKQNCYESSIRIPLIFSGPGVSKNRKIEKLVYLNDVFPTLCELAKLDVPTTVESKSLKIAFKRNFNEFKGRDHAFFSYLNLQRAIVKDNYKLIIYNVHGNHPLELFDLHKDPNELTNLALKPAYQNKVNELFEYLDKTMKVNDDFCDLKERNWGSFLKWNREKVNSFNP